MNWEFKKHSVNENKKQETQEAQKKLQDAKKEGIDISGLDFLTGEGLKMEIETRRQNKTHKNSMTEKINKEEYSYLQKHVKDDNEFEL